MTDAMIRFRKKGIDAVYVYPYANSDKRVTVYELRAEDIDSVVSKEVVYGNYRLGVLIFHYKIMI